MMMIIIIIILLAECEASSLDIVRFAMTPCIEIISF